MSQLRHGAQRMEAVDVDEDDDEVDDECPRLRACSS